MYYIYLVYVLWYITIKQPCLHGFEPLQITTCHITSHFLLCDVILVAMWHHWYLSMKISIRILSGGPLNLSISRDNKKRHVKLTTFSSGFSSFFSDIFSSSSSRDSLSLSLLFVSVSNNSSFPQFSSLSSWSTKCSSLRASFSNCFPSGNPSLSESDVTLFLLEFVSLGVTDFLDFKSSDSLSCLLRLACLISFLAFLIASCSSFLFLKKKNNFHQSIWKLFLP